MANSLVPPLLTLRTGVQCILVSWRNFPAAVCISYTTLLDIGIALDCRQIVMISYSSNPTGATYKSEYNEIILTHFDKMRRLFSACRFHRTVF